LVLGLFVWNSLTCTLSTAGRDVNSHIYKAWFLCTTIANDEWLNWANWYYDEPSIIAFRVLGFGFFFQSSLAFHMVHTWEIVPSSWILWWTQHYRI
jgi:hypothetical protein